MLLWNSTVYTIDVLLRTIISRYMLRSYCLMIISDNFLDINFPIPFTSITPKQANLTEKLLEASERQCSDYIVHMSEPSLFMEALKVVNQYSTFRRSNKKILFLPFLHDDISDSEQLLSVLPMSEASFMANILLIIPSNKANIQNCEIYDVVTHRFVGANEEANDPLYLDRWDSCLLEFVNKVNLFPHDITDLRGKTLKVAAFPHEPYTLLDIDPKIEPLGRDGVEMRIVHEFCRWVNCTIELVREDIYEWGDVFENHTGVGVVGNLVEDKADIGISALYSWYKMYQYLDFATPHIRAVITCLAPAPRLTSSWELPFLPFSWQMWLLVFFTAVFTFLALAYVGKSFDRACLTTFGVMVTQSQVGAVLGKCWRIRSVTGWLIITGFVLDNAYSSGLASTFTVPKYEKKIDTIQDLVNSNMEWGATHDAWIYSLTPSSDPQIRRLVNLFRIYSTEELKAKSFTRSMAFAIGKLPGGNFALGDYLTNEALLNLEIMSEEFYFEQCVTMLRKNSPYTNKISQLVGLLHQSGLILAWETQVAIKYLDFEEQQEVRYSRSRRKDMFGPLSMWRTEGIFIIYTFGMGISCLAFLGELYYYYYYIYKKNILNSRRM